MTLFTVNMRVAGWPCLVVGAGSIALPKAKRLIEAGAHVTIVAPDCPDALAGATLIKREANLEDLTGVRLAIFGTDDKELNRRLYHEAVSRGILAAAVDDLENADFYMPAILRRGDLEVAVSSTGKGPAYSVWVRDRLAELLDDTYGEALAWFSRLRRTHLRDWTLPERTKAFKALLSRDFLTFFREDNVAAWDRESESILASLNPSGKGQEPRP